jgi:hypothetical protein
VLAAWFCNAGDCGDPSRTQPWPLLPLPCGHTCILDAQRKTHSWHRQHGMDAVDCFGSHLLVRCRLLHCTRRLRLYRGYCSTFRYMYRYKGSRGYTWQATSSSSRDTSVPLDRPEACLRGLSLGAVVECLKMFLSCSIGAVMSLSSRSGANPAILPLHTVSTCQLLYFLCVDRRGIFSRGRPP